MPRYILSGVPPILSTARRSEKLKVNSVWKGRCSCVWRSTLFSSTSRPLRLCELGVRPSLSIRSPRASPSPLISHLSPLNMIWLMAHGLWLKAVHFYALPCLSRAFARTNAYCQVPFACFRVHFFTLSCTRALVFTSRTTPVRFQTNAQSSSSFPLFFILHSPHLLSRLPSPLVSHLSALNMVWLMAHG